MNLTKVANGFSTLPARVDLNFRRCHLLQRDRLAPCPTARSRVWKGSALASGAAVAPKGDQKAVSSQRQNAAMCSQAFWQVMVLTRQTGRSWLADTVRT